MQKLTEGQELYWVPSRNRYENPREVVVLKVGRKWAQLDNRERIDVNTLIADGSDYMSPGRCYLSADEYETELALNSAWRELRDRLQLKYHSPEGVTVADIEAAMKLLRISTEN